MGNTVATIRGLYEYDPSIFDEMTYPEDLDKDTLIAMILDESEEMPVLWFNPLVMKEKIKYWSQSRSNAWNRIYTALTEAYNPVHNYDRYESWEDSGESEAGGDNTRSVTAFNTNTFADAEKNTASSSGSSSSEHSGHMYGNIGVTTAEQMITEELELRKTDMYNLIAKEFTNKFCVGIY